VQNDLTGTEGLGVANSHQPGISSQDVGFIAPTDAVARDFANVKASVTTGGTTYSENQVTFNVYQDYAGADYEVYGLVSGKVKPGRIDRCGRRYKPARLWPASR
jgi:hypothetical protein